MHAHFLDLETPASSGRINSLPQSHTYLEGSERPTGSRSLSKCGSVGNLSLSLSFLLSALSLSSPFLSYLAVLSPPSPLFSPPVSFLPSALSDSVLLLQLQYSLCSPGVCSHKVCDCLLPWLPLPSPSWGRVCGSVSGLLFAWKVHSPLLLLSRLCPPELLSCPGVLVSQSGPSTPSSHTSRLSIWAVAGNCCHNSSSIHGLTITQTWDPSE